MGRHVLWAMVVALVLTGCAVEIPRQNILMFAADGGPIDPADTGWFGAWISGYGELLDAGDKDAASQPQRSYVAYVDRMLEDVRLWHDQSPEHRELVLFVHGGMNSQTGSVDRAVELADRIRADGAYPLFVNWRSSLLNCYADHLFFVRQGSRSFGPRNDFIDDTWDTLGFLLFPFQLVADLVRGVLRFPIVALNQLESTVEWQGWGRSPSREAADRALEQINTCAPGRPPQHIFLFNQKDEEPERAWQERVEVVAGGVWWVITLPVKAVSTIIVDAGGQGSWEVMRRRVDLLFHPELEYQGDLTDRQPRGLLYAMEQLHELQRQLEQADTEACRLRDHGDCQHGLEITLVGHSMGAIVLNQLVQHGAMYAVYEDDPFSSEVLVCVRHGPTGCECARPSMPSPAVDPDCKGCRLVPGVNRELRLPRYSNLVYLAAACSVREYEDAAFAYMAERPGVNVFHVVLNPRNERGESNFLDLAPRGSLLTWWDDFLAKPLTPRDRTAGSYTNLLPALHDTPRALRPRVHVRVLPWADDGLPQAHGDFSGDECLDFRFWDESTWFPPGARSGAR